MLVLCAHLALAIVPVPQPHSRFSDTSLVQTNGPGEIPEWAKDLASKVGLTPEQVTSVWKKDAEKYGDAGSNRSMSVRLLNAGCSKETLSDANVAAKVNLRAANAAQTNTKSYTVGVLQMTSVHGDTPQSMTKAGRLLNASSTQSAIDLLVLPELAFSGYMWEKPEEVAPFAEAQDGATFQWARQQAQALHSWVLVGYPEKDSSGKMFNSALLLDSNGELKANIRKSNLTPTDAKWAHPSNAELTVVNTDKFGKIGIGICADISLTTGDLASNGGWYLDKVFAQAKVDMIVLLAAWDEDKPSSEIIGLWKTRLGENSGTPVIFVAADQTGSERGEVYGGSSCVVDLKNTQTLRNFEREEGLLVQSVKDQPIHQGLSCA